MTIVFVHQENGHGEWVERHDFWPWSYRWTGEDAARIRELFRSGVKADVIRSVFKVSEVELQDVC